MGSRSDASGWGDLAAALVLLGAAGCLAPAMLPVTLYVVACSAIVVAATGVLIHSSAFWADELDTLPRQVNEFVLIFSSYPQTVYGPWLRLVLFTVIPAGFIGYLPVEVLRAFSWREAAYLGGGAVLYATAAVTVFRAGLRRYTSGNRTGLMA
jgi:ABC-2 type transport system permease protein